MGAATTETAKGGRHEPPTPMETLDDDFPGWRPWRSSAGRCWAVRTTTQGPVKTPDGWAMTVDADTPAKLRAVLEEQERLPGGTLWKA